MRSCLQPGPVFGPPPVGVRVAAGLHELQERRVRDVVAFDARTPSTSAVRAGNSLSQPKGIARGRRRASRGRPGRRSIRRRAPVHRRAADSPSGRRFSIERQPMPHVQQRLLMHRFVLEDRERRFRAIEQRMTRTIESSDVSASRTCASASSANACTSARVGHRGARFRRPACRARTDRCRARTAARAARRCSAGRARA